MAYDKRQGGKDKKWYEKRAQKPGMTSDSPRAQERSARYDDRKPGFGDERPRSDDRRPGYSGDRPRFDDRKLGYGGDRPRFDDRKPGYGGDRPRFDDRRPRPEGDRPRFDDRRPRPEGDRPRFDDRRRAPQPYPRTVAPEGYPEAAEAGFEGTPDLPRENMLVGRNPIREALKSGRDMEKLLVARGDLSGSAREILAMAKERHVVVQEVERVRLDALSPGHQGMVAFASAYRYATVEDMLALAKEREEPPFLVILDGITDPHNLGAIIRTAECAGAHGVIVQERRAVGLTPAAVKASAGAVEHLPVARVGNITRLIETLKAQNIWVYAAAMEGERYDRCDLSGAVALVIGDEGEGISRLVLEKCDARLALPLAGRIASLNASVAAGVLLYEVVRRRKP